MKIEAPGGKTEDLHRRVWVGVGGTSEPSYLRTSLSLARRGQRTRPRDPVDLRRASSRRAAARAYFHGGLSPQELIVPVVVMTPTAQAVRPADRHQVDADARARRSSRRGSSRSRSPGRPSGCSGWSRPRCGSKSGPRGSASPCPVSASYGFEEATGDVKLQAVGDGPQADRARTP